MLAKKEAWKWVANDLLESRSYGFICNSIMKAYMDDRITNETKLQMISDLSSLVYGDPKVMHNNAGAFRMNTEDEISWFVSVSELNNRRALLCLFISQLTDAEIEEMNDVQN